MSEPIFVRVRNDQGKIYDSYDIIWQLINWNFPSCEMDEVERDSDKIYIFTPNNGNVAAFCSVPHTARYILWQLEIPGWEKQEIPNYMDEMWVSDRYWQSLVPEAKFVPIGGDKRLYLEPAAEKVWDFCTSAYLYGRREAIVAEMKEKGFTFAPNGFGEVRDEAIAKSRWGLCLHQNPVPAMSPQRMTLFACRKLPIVLESGDAYPYEVIYLDYFERKDYSELAEINFVRFTEKLIFKECVEAVL